MQEKRECWPGPPKRSRGVPCKDLGGVQVLPGWALTRWREVHSWRRTEQEEGRKRCREEDVLERTFRVRLEP